MLKLIKPVVALFALFALTVAAAMADRVIIIEKPDVQRVVVVEREKPAEHRPLIQLALLLDTSGSMEGLINQARAQLWTIVNELAATKRNGQVPELQVALYHYGNATLPASEGYIRQLVPFTTDLDAVSRELFALRTNGGSEYCGQVIDVAVEELDWSKRDDVYKVVFIAGNEPFTQGQTPYQEAISKARSNNIIVNTIHCGNEQQGVGGQWHTGARLGGGDFFNIDHDREVVYIQSPYDDKIRELNVELNKTYIWFGEAGREAAENQAAQDTLNAGLSEAAELDRIKTKSNAAVYRHRADLVDASKDKQFKLDEVADEVLPEPMQKMNETERQAFIAANASRRSEVQAQIAELSKKRDAHIAAEREKQAGADAEATLGEAVSRATREQAAKHGFKRSKE